MNDNSESFRTKHNLPEDPRRRIAMLHEHLFHQVHLEPFYNLILESLTLSRSLGDPLAIAESLTYLGKCIQTTDDALSLLHLQEACALYEAHGTPLQQAIAFKELGTAFRHAGQYPAAIDTLQKSLSLMEADRKENRKAKKVYAQAQNSIGIVYSTLGNYAKALSYYRESLKLREELGDSDDIGVMYTNIGNVYYRLGNLDTALEYYFKRLDLCHQTGNQRTEALILQNIGGVCEQRGEYDGALRYLMQSLELFEGLNDKAGKSRVLGNIGVNYRYRGELEIAYRYHQEALHLAEGSGDREVLIGALINLGDVHREMKHCNEALPLLHHALFVSREAGIVHYMTDIYRSLSHTYEQAGENRRALEYYKFYSAVKQEAQLHAGERSLLELQTRLGMEQVEKENEIFRLKNIDLAQTLAEAESLNTHLLALHREKTDLLGIVAHDLQNPLNNILMLAQILHNESASLLKDEYMEFVNDMDTTISRMLGLVKELLSVNSLESGTLSLRFEDFDLASVVRPIVDGYSMRAHTKNIQLHYTQNAEKHSVHADRNATVHIIDNLLSNAIKFSPPDKNIYIEIWNVETGVECIVRDEGPGLTEEDKQKVFGKFARLSARPTAGEQSTGLGLSIVEKLSTMMHGSIRCESEAGKGASFICQLPGPDSGQAMA